jgi:hypothetical protein
VAWGAGFKRHRVGAKGQERNHKELHPVGVLKKKKNKNKTNKQKNLEKMTLQKAPGLASSVLLGVSYMGM